MPDYSNDPVVKQLAAQRSGIGQQVQGALGEIGRRETAAQGSVAGYQDTLSNIYQGYGADAANAPSLQILRASQEATSPLVQMGFTDLFQRQRGGLEQARLLEEGNLATQEASHLSQLQAADADRNFQRDQKEKDRAESRATARAAQRDPIADYAAKLGIDKHLGIGDFAPQPEKPRDLKDPKVVASDILGGRNKDVVDADMGGFFSFLDDPNDNDDHYSRIQNNPAYQQSVAAINNMGAKFRSAKPEDKAAMVSHIARALKLDPAAESVLQYSFGAPLGADSKYNTFLQGLYAGGA